MHQSSWFTFLLWSGTRAFFFFSQQISLTHIWNRRLAAEYGLSLVYKKRLHDLYAERFSEGEDGALFRRMLGNKNVTEDEWEAIGEHMGLKHARLYDES